MARAKAQAGAGAAEQKGDAASAAGVRSAPGAAGAAVGAASKTGSAAAAKPEGVADAFAGMRIGLGEDVHKLVAGRRLVVGGVTIPFEKGLLGHSDADVLAHAVSDALLGAARLGDIGKLFPDTSDAWEGADSMRLLAIVAKKVREAGYAVVDVDSVLVAQRPKVSPYRDQMRRNLASAMGVDVSQVGVKATTSEGLGFEGRGEGMSARAVALLCESDALR